MSRQNVHTTVEQATARSERFLTENKWDVLLKHERALKVKERNELVKQGLITEKLNLEDAVAMQGTCEDMCPALERIERKIQRQLDSLEMIPGTSDPDPARCVKMFHRPTATLENLPSDVRPPHILKMTLDYLFGTILPVDSSLDTVHLFLRDRTRSIRQDFAIQHTQEYSTIECHERIARFHILVLHEMRSAFNQDQETQSESYSEQQEIEQLNKTLTSLMHLYDDSRHASLPCPNEPEFRAFNLLLHISNPDVIRQTELLPLSILKSPTLRVAIQLCTMVQRPTLSSDRALSSAFPHVFTRFFKEIQRHSVSFLMACLLEHHFAEVRKGALLTMANSFLASGKTPAMPLADVREMLAFDSDAEVQDFAVDVCGLEVDSSGIKLNRKIELTPTPKGGHQIRVKSNRLVAAKRGTLSFRDIVDGKIPTQRPAPTPIQPYLRAANIPKPPPENVAVPSLIPRRPPPPPAFTVKNTSTPSGSLNPSLNLPIQTFTPEPIASALISRAALFPTANVAPAVSTTPPSQITMTKSQPPLPTTFHTSLKFAVQNNPLPPPLASTSSTGRPLNPVTNVNRAIRSEEGKAASVDLHSEALLQTERLQRRREQTTQLAHVFIREWILGFLRPAIYEALATECYHRHLTRRVIRGLARRQQLSWMRAKATQEKALRTKQVQLALDSAPEVSFDEFNEDQQWENAGASIIQRKPMDPLALAEMISKTSEATARMYARGAFLRCIRSRALGLMAGRPMPHNWGLWLVAREEYWEEDTRISKKLTESLDEELDCISGRILSRALGTEDQARNSFLGLIMFPTSASANRERDSQLELQRLHQVVQEFPVNNPYGPCLLVLAQDLPGDREERRSAISSRFKKSLDGLGRPFRDIQTAFVGAWDEDAEFERQVVLLDFDVTGSFSPKVGLQVCLDYFTSLWERTLDDALALLSAIVEQRQEPWVLYAHLLEIIVNGLNAAFMSLSPHICRGSLWDRDTRIATTALTHFDPQQAYDQRSLFEQVFKYLQSLGVAGLSNLETQIQSALMHKGDFPIREIALYLKSMVENKLWLLGDQVFGEEWVAGVEDVAGRLKAEILEMHKGRALPRASSSAKRRRISENSTSTGSVDGPQARNHALNDIYRRPAKKLREREGSTSPASSYVEPTSTWVTQGVSELELAMARAALLVDGLENLT